MTSGLRLAMSCQTDPGCVRSVNEDAAAVLAEAGFAVVADGMGGHSAGALAARIAVSRIVERLRQTAPGGTREAMEGALRGAFAEANRAIRDQAASDAQCKDMGATVASLLVRGAQACLAHLGDSRIYRLRAGKLALLTRDHSLTQQVRDLGVIGEDAIAASHNRHLVSEALGYRDEPPLVVQHTECRPGDLFLLCTDGLNDMVDGADIELALRVLRSNLPLAARQLVSIARDNGGYDNITVALVHCAEAPPEAPPPAPRGLAARCAAWLRRLLSGGR